MLDATSNRGAAPPQLCERKTFYGPSGGFVIYLRASQTIYRRYGKCIAKILKRIYNQLCRLIPVFGHISLGGSFKPFKDIG